ncbi:hypothetical protein DFH09DRAFT_1102450 [Mycena vulgaris]|nr:hypothetical protein DFH09DRAFT_1102450 [Mycena vulgaris]
MCYNLGHNHCEHWEACAHCNHHVWGYTFSPDFLMAPRLRRAAALHLSPQETDSDEARPRTRATKGEVDAALHRQGRGRERAQMRWRRQNGVSAREDPKCRATADGPRVECGRSSPPHSAERLALLRRKTGVRALRVRRLRAARGSSSAWSSGGVRRLREACEARRMGTTHDGPSSSLRAAFRRDETRNTEVGGTCVRSRRGDEKSRIGGTSRGGGVRALRRVPGELVVRRSGNAETGVERRASCAHRCPFGGARSREDASGAARERKYRQEARALATVAAAVI